MLKFTENICGVDIVWRYENKKNKQTKNMRDANN